MLLYFPPRMFTASLSDCSGLCLHLKILHSFKTRVSCCGLTVVLCKSSSCMVYWWWMLLFWETPRCCVHQVSLAVSKLNGGEVRRWSWQGDQRSLSIRWKERRSVCQRWRWILQCGDERSLWTVLESISDAQSLMESKRVTKYPTNVNLYCIQIFTNAD